MFMSYDHGNSIFALFRCSLKYLRLSFKILTMFHKEQLVLILKPKNTSWMAMSSVRKNQNPLSCALSVVR
jgi:hypothetical protein